MSKNFWNNRDAQGRFATRMGPVVNSNDGNDYGVKPNGRKYWNHRDGGKFAKKVTVDVNVQVNVNAPASNVDDNWTEVVVLVDNSGSMGWGEYGSPPPSQTLPSEFTEFINEQKIGDGRMTVTSYNFEGSYFGLQLSRVDILSDPRISITPRGGTPLYDSIAKAIARTEETQRGDTVKPGRVIFLIITDGLENSSREYHRHARGAERIGQLIENKTQNDLWQFVYIGANQDAHVEAKKFGVRKGEAQTYNTSEKGVKNIMKSVSEGVSSKRSMTKEVYTSSTLDGLFFDEK